jgi:nifR3 family TIM-barrel protein
MISAKALTYDNKKTFELFDRAEEKEPVSVQLFGSEPQTMAEAAQILEGEGVRLIDINMGCPVPKVVKSGEGSALMKDTKLAASIVRAVCNAVKIPITAKIRKGWNAENMNAVEFALALEEAGAFAIAVHGRTREQYYSGKADWQIIAEVKRNLKVPVIASGDIFSVEDAKEVLEQTGVDALMVARGVLGRPWFIGELVAALTGKSFSLPETPGKKLAYALEHARLLVRFKGEERGIREIRKHLTWYIKGMPAAAKKRGELSRLHTLADVEAFLEDYVERGKTGETVRQ